MIGYRAIFSARFRTLLQYRAAAAAGFGTQLFWGLIRVMIFGAFYRSTTAAQPMSYEEVVTYIWLGQAMILIVIHRADADVQAMIRSGTVAYEMLRPLDVFTSWFVRSVALRTAPVLLRAVPMFIVAGLLLGLGPPASPAAAVMWMAATVGAVLLASAIAVLLTISMLWTVAGEGISRLVPAAVFVFSGMIIPLPLFPDWAQPVLNFLPFRGLADVPFRLYMGHIEAAEGIGVLAHQMAWTVALVMLGRWLLRRGLRRLVVQGG